MDIRKKTGIISGLFVAGCLGLTAAVYVLFHVFFVLIIFVPSLIYYFLQRRNAKREGQ